MRRSCELCVNGRGFGGTLLGGRRGRKSDLETNLDIRPLIMAATLGGRMVQSHAFDDDVEDDFALEPDWEGARLL